MTETYTESPNNSELKQSKEEMVKRIVEEIKKKDLTVDLLWKKSVSKYLLDEKDSKVRNFFTGLGLNVFSIFSSASKELKQLKEKMDRVKTKEELDNLEKSIIESLNESKESDSSSTSSAQTASSSSSSEGRSSSSESSAESTESVVESAKVWEAANIEKSKRCARLFPEGKPKSAEQMRKYLTRITVPIRTADWKESTHTLNIHKKLANVYKAIFKEMYDKNIPVNPTTTWWYCRRLVRGSKTKLSEHCFWGAVDLNWDVNWWVYGPDKPGSKYFNGSDTVRIWKKYGFYRWWDRSARKNDPMHFTYMGW